MSFGVNKRGTNNTDKNLAVQWAKEGRSVDWIASRLSVKGEMVAAILEQKSAPVKKVKKAGSEAE